LVSVEGEALASLVAALDDLLPPAPDLAFRPTLAIQSLGFTPIGLGGFVGMNGDPRGEIHGRLVRARVLATVRAAAHDGLPAAALAVIQALAAAEAATLRQRGILRIGPADLQATASVSPPADGAPAEQGLAFDVLYEFLKRPEEAEGIIEEIPLQVEIG
jgi:hypothetical protein